MHPLSIIVLTGASGAGKTTLALKLNDLGIPGVKGFNCDRVKIESDEMADPQADVLRVGSPMFSFLLTITDRSRSEFRLCRSFL